MTDLLQIIPARWRHAVYGVRALLGLIIGCVLVGYTAVGETLPVWLVITLAVLAYLGIPVDGVARANVSPDAPERRSILP